MLVKWLWMENALFQIHVKGLFAWEGYEQLTVSYGSCLMLDLYSELKFLLSLRVKRGWSIFSGLIAIITFLKMYPHSYLSLDRLCNGWLIFRFILDF